MANPNWVKGVSGNPRGPKKGFKREISIVALREALSIVEAEKGRVPILVHAWRRAYESDAVLSTLLKKFIPDVGPAEEKISNADDYFKQIADAISKSDTNAGSLLSGRASVCN